MLLTVPLNLPNTAPVPTGVSLANSALQDN